MSKKDTPNPYQTEAEIKGNREKWEAEQQSRDQAQAAVEASLRKKKEFLFSQIIPAFEDFRQNPEKYDMASLAKSIKKLGMSQVVLVTATSHTVIYQSSPSDDHPTNYLNDLFVDFSKACAAEGIAVATFFRESLRIQGDSSSFTKIEYEDMTGKERAVSAHLRDTAAQGKQLILINENISLPEFTKDGNILIKHPSIRIQARNLCSTALAANLLSDDERKKVEDFALYLGKEEEFKGYDKRDYSYLQYCFEKTLVRPAAATSTREEGAAQVHNPSRSAQH